MVSDLHCHNPLFCIWKLSGAPFCEKSNLCKQLASLIEGASKQCTVDILHYCHFRQDNSVVVGKVCHISYK